MKTLFLLIINYTFMLLLNIFIGTIIFVILQDCMKGSPAKARVLYAPVEEVGSEGRLLRACRIHM